MTLTSAPSLWIGATGRYLQPGEMDDPRTPFSSDQPVHEIPIGDVPRQ
jgi:hypothetical protein